MNEQNTVVQNDNERDALFVEARALGVSFSNNIGTDTLRARVTEAKNKKAAEQAAQDAGHTDDDDAGETAATVTLDPAVFVAGQLQNSESEVNSNPYVANAPNVDITPINEPVTPGAVDPNVTPTVVMTARVTKPVAAHEDIDLSGFTDPAQYRSALIKRERRMVRVRIENLNPKKADLTGEIFAVSNEFIGNVKMFVPYGETTDDGWHIPYCIYKQLKAKQFQHIRTYTDKITKQLKVETSLRNEFALSVMEPLTPADLADLRAASAGQ